MIHAFTNFQNVTTFVISAETSVTSAISTADNNLTFKMSH